MATNGSDSGSAQRQAKGPNLGLMDQAKSWPTPTACSENSIRGAGQDPDVRRQNGHAVNLQDAVHGMAKSLHPVHSMIDGRELSPTVRTLRPRLNPAFACWLMGWPIWWTNPEITNSVKSEMELYRCRLQSHLSSFFGAQAR